jgi:hypothetical protein
MTIEKDGQVCGSAIVAGGGIIEEKNAVARVEDIRGGLTNKKFSDIMAIEALNYSGFVRGYH